MGFLCIQTCVSVSIYSSCSFSLDIFFCLFVSSYSVLLVFYHYFLDVCFLMKDRKKGCELVRVGSNGGSGKNLGRENHN